MSGPDIQSIMVTSVITAPPSMTVREALLRLEDMDIRHLPVVDEGRLVGIVSDRDLREFRLPLMEEIEDPERADELLGATVADAMNADVVSLDTSEELSDAVDAMLEYKIGAVPVVDRHTDQLVGIISYMDVLRILRPDI